MSSPKYPRNLKSPRNFSGKADDLKKKKGVDPAKLELQKFKEKYEELTQELKAVQSERNIYKRELETEKGKNDKLLKRIELLEDMLVEKGHRLMEDKFSTGEKQSGRNSLKTDHSPKPEEKRGPAPQVGGYFGSLFKS